MLYFLIVIFIALVNIESVQQNSHREFWGNPARQYLIFLAARVHEQFCTLLRESIISTDNSVDNNKTTHFASAESLFKERCH